MSYCLLGELIAIAIIEMERAVKQQKANLELTDRMIPLLGRVQLRWYSARPGPDSESGDLRRPAHAPKISSRCATTGAQMHVDFGIAIVGLFTRLTMLYFEVPLCLCDRVLRACPSIHLFSWHQPNVMSCST
jgi:hypothetical protein